MDETNNPIGTKGLAFVEFSVANNPSFVKQLNNLGMLPARKHEQADITVYEQGNICFIVNNTNNTHASEFAKMHGSAPSAMGFRVNDAQQAYQTALDLGATGVTKQCDLYGCPAIEGIGGSLIYFVSGDNYFSDKFTHTLPVSKDGNLGLYYLDHLTHNVYQGKMDYWTQDFYGKIFNFRQIRYFDIEGKKTGLISRALRSPCNQITIPINESKDANSQIAEYLTAFNGEGIQHIALATKNIYATMKQLKENGVQFMQPPPATYYEKMAQRFSGHQEDFQALAELGILIDGYLDDGKPQLLLQIFTENLLGPVFFEIIQRKGDEGFGEGNFTALFESIEEDQMRRGGLK